MGRPRTYGEALEAVVKAMETEDPEERRKILADLKRGIRDLKKGENPPLAGRTS